MKPFFAFQWHITDACDQRCKHCYIFSEGQHAIDSMSWEDMMVTLAQIEDFCNTYGRRPYIYLTGGDPILHPDFWRLLDLFNQKSIPFTIMGNPFHLTPEVCAALKERGCQKYQMSIDGLEKTHDWFRKPGSFRETLQKIDMINNAGIRSVIMTTVSGVNIKEIPGIIDAVAQADVNVYAFSRYCPTSEEKADPSNANYMTPEAYRDLLSVCDAKFKAYEKAGCQTYFNKKDHLWTLYDYETGAFSIPEQARPDVIYGGCHCGDSHLTILPNGDIYACRRVQNSRVGSVYSDRMADVWVSQMDNYRHFDRFQKCAKCELKAWCRGCPAVASGARGDFYDADPQCWKIVEDD